MSTGSSDSDCWKAWAVPWNAPVRAAGAPSRARCWSTIWVAWPSDTPDARLKDMVAAGNWLWWLMVRLLEPWGSTLTNCDSGTVFPVRGESR